MKASDAFALMLASHGVQYCFELTGGMLTHLIDSIAEQGQMTLVSMHHEQAAAFAAEGVVRGSDAKTLAVAMGTSGPGATNLITGISSCWFDSVPCLFITGQVNRIEIKQNKSLRQQGFQELDIVEMVQSVTKYAQQVDDEMSLLPMMHTAVGCALSGRRGPVLLDIPNDIQRMELPDAHVHFWLKKSYDFLPKKPTTLYQSELDKLQYVCRHAKRPLICFGGGAVASEMMQPWLTLLRQYEIPHVSTLMGQKVITAHDCYFHMIGTYGNREANWAVQHCDVLIVLGARLDIRQTGNAPDDFGRNAFVVQVDIDPCQLNNRVLADLSITCDMTDFFNLFPMQAVTFSHVDHDWLINLRQQKRSADCDEYRHWALSPYHLIHALNQVMQGQPCHYVCDVGNHQMWAAQLIRLGDQQRIHHDGGLGAMGFSLPVAIGIALESSEKTIVICGDGGMQLNIQELDTIDRLQLNITVIVLNNHALGMVKNFQDMYFDGRNHSTLKGYSAPSFCQVAKAYRFDTQWVQTYEDWTLALKTMRQTNQPLLIEVMMPDATECRPRLAFGNPLDRQYPMQDESDENS